MHKSTHTVVNGKKLCYSYLLNYNIAAFFQSHIAYIHIIYYNVMRVTQTNNKK